MSDNVTLIQEMASCVAWQRWPRGRAACTFQQQGLLPSRVFATSPRSETRKDSHRLVDLREKARRTLYRKQEGRNKWREGRGAGRRARRTGGLLQKAGSGYLGSRSSCGSSVKCPDEAPALTRLPRGEQRHLGKGGATRPRMTSASELRCAYCACARPQLPVVTVRHGFLGYQSRYDLERAGARF